MNTKHLLRAALAALVLSAAVWAQDDPYAAVARFDGQQRAGLNAVRELVVAAGTDKAKTAEIETKLVAALAAGDHQALAAAMDDRVHQPYRLPLIPGADRAMAAARDAGAVGVVISGAGPSLLALCDRDADLVAEAMQRAWASKGIRTTRYLLEMDVRGARVVAR